MSENQSIWMSEVLVYSNNIYNISSTIACLQLGATCCLLWNICECINNRTFNTTELFLVDMRSFSYDVTAAMLVDQTYEHILMSAFELLLTAL